MRVTAQAVANGLGTFAVGWITNNVPPRVGIGVVAAWCLVLGYQAFRSETFGRQVWHRGRPRLVAAYILVGVIGFTVAVGLLAFVQWREGAARGGAQAPPQPPADAVAPSAKPVPAQQPAYISLRLGEATQFLNDDRGGVYIVFPDIQLSNRGDSGAIANLKLLVHRERGVTDHLSASLSRVPEIEAWLKKHGIGNDHFLGRQINVPPKTGVSGYMIFYADQAWFAMTGISPRVLGAQGGFDFQLEQSGQKPRTILYGMALMGKD